MTSKEALKTLLAELYPAAIFDEGGEWLNVNIEALSWKQLALQLRSDPALHFDYLFCLTCIDWKTFFTVVMHLTSTSHRHTIVVKTKLEKADPFIETVSDIWKTAEFHEREVYDLFGIRFTGHPDLRRLFMTEDCNGWPLRKDYEDAINMIKL